MMRKWLILVVDDEPPIVRLVRAKLQVDGYAVDHRRRGAKKRSRSSRTSGRT